MGRVLSESELYHMAREKRLTSHQVMLLIENAKTIMDLKLIHDNGHLQWGRGRHDDTCLKDAFLNRCIMITGRHWSDIVIRGMMI